MVTFSSAGSHFWTGGHIVSNMLYKDKKKHLRTQVLFSMKRTLRCMKSEAGLRPMKRGFAAWRGTGASRLPTANASSPIMLLSRVKSLRRRGILFHILRLQNTLRIHSEPLLRFFFDLSCIVKNPKIA